MFTRNKISIKTKILLPMILAILSIFIIEIILDQRSQKEVLSKNLIKSAMDAEKQFSNLEERDVKVISTVLQSLANDEKIKEIFLEKDREKLYSYCLEIFESNKQSYGITHWYFIQPDGKTFLRMHDKNLFDDQIERLTFIKAKDGQKTSSGLELGKTAFALRVVAPYYFKGNLIGYMELAQEIDHFLSDLSKDSGNEFALVVDKNNISSNDWKLLRERNGLNNNWNELNDYLIISKSFQENSIEERAVNAYISPKYFMHPHYSSEDMLMGEYKEDHKIFNIGEFHIKNVSGKETGSVYAVFDVTKVVYEENTKTLINLGIIAVLALFFIGLISVIINRNVLHSIMQVNNEMKNVVRNNYSTNIKNISNDEIGDLGIGFNKMIAEIKQSRSEVDKKVEEQTEEISQKSKDLEDQQKAILNILEDIDEEKKKISESYAKDDALLQSLGDGVIAVDKEGKIMFMNSSAQDILGWKIDEVAGKKMHEVVHIEDEKGNQIAENERPMQIALSTGRKIITSTTTNYYYLKKDNTKFPVAISVAPIILDNQTIGAIDVFRDVTHEKEVDRMKTEFISLASHQLRTPLSAMKWFSEMLMAGDAGKLTAEQSDFIKNIYDSNERMIQLVNSLLNISRIESGRIIIDPVPSDLGELVKQTLKELEVKIKEKEQNLVVSIHPDLPKINIDPKLILEVYKNLLTNAIKYTPPKGEISIFISKKDSAIISQISDNGYGIPKKEQNRIFEKFFRAENIVKLETEGTGLGLYLVKAIVESSGGKIWFTSEEGKGTSFYFSLPLTGSIAKTGEVAIDS